jgi:glycosyltransferase involved in cell wall biosynthesis
MTPTFSVCIPSYNAASIIGKTLESLFAQTYADFEVVVVDDASTDGTEEVVRAFGDPRVRIERNDVNLGYAGNVARVAGLARGKYLYLLGNDDVLSPVALERTLAAFESDPGVALVTRPYYWFEGDDTSRAVRHVPPLDAERDRIVPIDTDDRSFIALLDTLGQLSGLGFRRDVMEGAFDPEVFTAHARPFLATWKHHKAVFLKDYVLAVRIESSQTRYLPSIYEPSPVWTWVRLFDTVFAEPQFARQRALARRHLAGHVFGLAQIRCRAPYRTFLREAGVLVRYRKQNLVRPAFWAALLGFSVVPRALLIQLIDRFKPFVSRTSGQQIALK